MKYNSPTLHGIWQVFTATLIQEYLVLQCLFSPPHIQINDIHWLTGCTLCIDKPQGTAYSQWCAVPSVGLRSFHSFSPLPEALPPACISPLRTNYALWGHCNERHRYYPAWVGKHWGTWGTFSTCAGLWKKTISAGLRGSRPDTISGTANPPNK